MFQFDVQTSPDPTTGILEVPSPHWSTIEIDQWGRDF